MDLDDMPNVAKFEALSGRESVKVEFEPFPHTQGARV
jgi:hypothetical protein